MKPYILGIESSCDDTAIAIVDEQGQVYASVVSSQATIHNQFGGVFPELAGRAHVASILPAVDQAMATAGITPQDLEAIAVTRGPGLIGSLLVGLNTAAGLGMGWNVPVIGINHLRGHLRSADLEEKRVEYPALLLLVSGGHTFLAHLQDEATIQLLGSTRDDSVGEAFDKVGRMLNLGYPGGPAIDKAAREGKDVIPFPRPMLHEGLEFSFSGLKSAVARYLDAEPSPVVANVAASFVAAAMDILITKCRKALKKYPVRSLVIVGGVAANSQLREHAAALCRKQGVKLCLPPTKWSTDNGAMIALAAWDYIRTGQMIPPQPTLQLSVSDY
ncbi:MAG: tRNA (adenosine(37)-N6)-threonylcarbamoyltransferase complex transferase subunit TsaD [Saprospiraceae bacterium]